MDARDPLCPTRARRPGTPAHCLHDDGDQHPASLGDLRSPPVLALGDARSPPREAHIDAWRVPPHDLDEPVDVTLELFAESAATVRLAVVRALPECGLEWTSFVYEPTPYPEPARRFDWDDRGPLAQPWTWCPTL
jgi:hypothetical protein